jgi:hypothetical protein
LTPTLIGIVPPNDKNKSEQATNNDNLNCLFFLFLTSFLVFCLWSGTIEAIYKKINAHKISICFDFSTANTKPKTDRLGKKKTFDRLQHY